MHKLCLSTCVCCMCCVLTLVWEMLVMVGFNILEWNFKTQVSYTTWMGLTFVMKSWDANIK
jgi:hypothetical protein